MVIENAVINSLCIEYAPELLWNRALSAPALVCFHGKLSRASEHPGNYGGGYFLALLDDVWLQLPASPGGY